MIGRRTLIAGAAALAAAPALAQRKAAGSNAGRAIGLQLYTVRTLFQADPVATLETLARIGYREVEYGGGGYEAMDPAMLRATASAVLMPSAAAERMPPA